mmetsp:Transcript_40065/g.105939  ORF Transcript_40065/g.105939 Transcript_40065/m.105939 type:complete len:196 (+) Transcript_40065:20-607(+)
MAVVAAIACRRARMQRDQARLRRAEDDSGLGRGTYLQQCFRREVHAHDDPDFWLPSPVQSGTLTLELRPGMEIRAVPLKYFEGNEDASPCECGICLSPLEHGQPLRVPACGHQFHSKCLRLWFEKGNPCCPTCRLQVSIPERGGADPSSHTETFDPSRGRRRWRALLSAVTSGRRNPSQRQGVRGPWPFLDDYVP